MISSMGRRIERLDIWFGIQKDIEVGARPGVLVAHKNISLLARTVHDYQQSRPR
jgi:hypothetical protein